MQAIRSALVAAAVAHADGTGLGVGGGLDWLHVLNTAQQTAYAAHLKRGADALDAFRLWAPFLGVLQQAESPRQHWRVVGAWGPRA